MADDIENAIRQSVQGPESAEADGVKVKQYPLPDQIAADKYLAGKEAVSRGPAKGFTRVKIVPPGTVSLMRLWPWTKRKKVEAVGQLMLVRARFDAAQTTPDNRKHWAAADPLSADAAASGTTPMGTACRTPGRPPTARTPTWPTTTATLTAMVTPT